MVIIRLNAGNDRNGNPRRVFVALDDSGIVKGTADEGYQGTGAIHDAGLVGQWEGETFETTPREYRELVKLDKRRG